jgi:zinc transport system substrate-binding protein
MGIHEHEGSEHKGHDINPSDDHSGKDPHIWMSPLLAKKQALTVCESLSEIDSMNKDFYWENYNRFAADLDRLHNTIKTKLAGFQDSDFFVFHPSFGYFADAYGLNQIAFEKMGKAPKGKAFAEIIKKIQLKKSKVVFVQPQFDKNTARKIAAAIKGRVVTIDPLAENYFENMLLIADTIAEAFSSGN